MIAFVYFFYVNVVSIRPMSFAADRELIRFVIIESGIEFVLCIALAIYFQDALQCSAI